MAKKKRKVSISNIILIVGIVVVMIPVIALGVILLQAQRGSNTPIPGNRFENERTYEISDTMLTDLEKELQNVAHLEKGSVSLKVATVRVYADVEDTLTEQEIEDVLMDIYETVDGSIPVETYFTLQGNAKEYDLEIHAYNNVELAGTEEYIYKILTKNSAMTTFVIDTASTARNEELANELTAVDDGTVVEGEGAEDTSESGETAGE